MKTVTTRWGLLVCAALTATSALAAVPFDHPEFLKAVRVPAGFQLSFAAGAPLIRFPMFACFDDAGRLYVAESSGNDLYDGLKMLTRDCRVSRLEDIDGDGSFEKVTVFQDRVTFPMGLAWREGRLYLADPPNLVALTDADGDGRADKREVILSGFGHTDNGSLHGLVFGPDGFLYFTMGTPDGWKLPRGDGTFLEGVAGALFRCQPDGSQLEVISRGFENLVEIEFMPGGEMIGTDNWYQVPANGLRDALIDCAPGGLYPYAPDRGTPLLRSGLTLPPLTLLPAVAHSGLTRLRNRGWPPAWTEGLFVAEHNTRRVVHHELRRDGSTFAATTTDLVVGDHPDFHPSDVLEDADGSLLVVDTGGWYVEHCPTGRIRDSRAPGGIYRVDWKQRPKPEDPRGTRLDWSGVTSAQLAERLSDARSVVAERAAAELVRRRAVLPLSAAVTAGPTPAARLAAIWALAQVPGEDSLPPLREQLASTDPTILCVTVRALALRGDRACEGRLLELLANTNAPVRRAAAEALRVCGSQLHVAKLLEPLTHARDDFELHACIAALQAWADDSLAREFLQHSSPRVRQAALQLLDQPPLETLRFKDLLPALGDDDPQLSLAARRLLERHPRWATEGAPWMREQLVANADIASPQAPALANLLIAFQEEAAVRGLISELLDPAAPTTESTRVLVLNLLPALNAQRWESGWLDAIEAAFTNATLRGHALQAAAASPQPKWEERRARIADDTTVPAAQRLLAARVSKRHPRLSDAVFALTVQSLSPAASATDRLGAVELLARSQLSATQLTRICQTLQPGGGLAPDVFLPAFARAVDDATRADLAQFFAAWLKAGWSPSRTTLDLALQIFSGNDAVRRSLSAAWERNNAAKLKRLGEHRELLSGGNAARGAALFETATCSGCHKVSGNGGVVGPDLTRVGAIRSGGDLLESILYPSSSLAQGYEPYHLTRRDGEDVSGNLVAQGPEGISLRDGTGMIHRVRPEQIASLERQQLSAMPEGLEQLLTREQFRDLLAYLQSLR